jgi:neutral ceramidase
MRLAAWFAVFFLTSVPFLCEASHTGLMAGAAKVDITPPVGQQLWGQASRIGPSTGILDALYARVLVLKSTDTSLAIVALDLGRTFGLAQMDAVRSRVKVQAGIQHVIFSATHTHTGPTLLDQQFIEPGMNRWEPRCLDAIVDAIGRASRAAVPCRLGAGKGASYIGHNRQDAVGTKMLGANETRVPTVPIDPIVQVLRVDGLDGKQIAVLANYASHPVVVGMENLTKYSADFPGAMCAYVERAIEGQPLAIFLQGACGDINPVYLRAGASEVRRVGQELGREVVKVAREIQPKPISQGRIQVVEERIRFRSRWNIEKLKSMQAVPTYHQWLSTGRPIGYPAEELETHITTVLINNHVALLTMPGEPYVEYQTSFRARLPGLDTILAGYSNGYSGYLPTIRVAVRDGVVYGGNAWPTILEVGTGERMIDRGIINVCRMLGRLRSAPSKTQPNQGREAQ